MVRFLTRRSVLALTGSLLGLVILLLAGWAAIAGPVTVARILRYGDTAIDDFSHYPARELAPSGRPFSFGRAAVDMQIPTGVLSEYGAAGDLERILEENDTIAFLVIQHDVIRYERYFQGHSQSRPSQVFSMSKSFTSALVGMAIDDGYIQSEEQSIVEALPLKGSG